MPKDDKAEIELLKTWTLPHEATLGSTVRVKGILQEIQARLPPTSRKSVIVEGRDVVLAMSATGKAGFNAAAAIVSKTVAEAATFPVIPREIEDILNIKTSERHRWLEDGRLPSAGTRTVRLNGRARRITFHVFDPRIVEDLLDRGAVDEWRIQDEEAKAERRAKAIYQAKLTRLLKKKTEKASKQSSPDEASPDLQGWDEFEGAGLLR